MDDTEFIYRLEARLIDLEEKVRALETRIEETRVEVNVLPEEIRQRIRRGEHPVRVLREMRLMTQNELSEICGIRANHISAIERGQSFGLKTARRLADALDVPADILL